MAFSFILDLWDKWNIRSIVILSFLLQVFLNLCAPLRKKIIDNRFIFLLLVAYYMADMVSIYGIGLISQNQGNSSTRADEVDKALQAFWASILLLHLGGPETITALSPEDSSLWRKHLLNLIFQVCVAIYVFVQIFPNDKSLVIPTILVFLAGITKNAERTLSFLFSSLRGLRILILISYNNFEPKNLGDELDRLGYEYSNEEETKLAESIVVAHAYHFFKIFVTLVGDLIFTRQQREMSREYFNKISAMDALRVISVELQYIYDVLHTKAWAMRCKWSYIFHFIAVIEVEMAFVLFLCLMKHRLTELDVKVTYILLFGRIAIYVIALFKLVLSDWTIAKIKGHNTRPSRLNLFLHKLVSATDILRKPRFAGCKVDTNAKVTYLVLDTRFIFRRWSESISTCNLFSEFLMKSPRKMYKHGRHWGIAAFCDICSFPFRMAEKIISHFCQAGERHPKLLRLNSRMVAATPKYVSQNPFVNKLWIFIFETVKRKPANNPIEVKKIFEARGDWLRQSSMVETLDLLEYVTEANYGESVIMWHIATEMWYNKEEQLMSPTAKDGREFSKILSDYMFYLLFNRPKVMSTVTSYVQNTITFGETLFELADRFNGAKLDLEGLCKRLFEDSLKLSHRVERSKSVLGQGTNLARKMESLEEMKWEVMSKVWVEMLSYAAVNIKGGAHVQALSEGGELLAFVWLLMAHFGCFFHQEWGIYYESRDEYRGWDESESCCE